MPELTPTLCKKQREALNLSEADLAQKANVAAGAIKNFEADKGINALARAKLTAALHEAGAEFPADPPKPPPAPESLTPAECKKWREDTGWTEQKLADKAGYEENTITQFEDGRKLEPAALAAIVKALRSGGLAKPDVPAAPTAPDIVVSVGWLVITAAAWLAVALSLQWWAS